MHSLICKCRHNVKDNKQNHSWLVNLSGVEQTERQMFPLR